MAEPSATVTAIRGGGDKPSWAPAWAPSSSTLDYLQKLAVVVFIVLGFFYFLGVDELKPFADRHVAAV